MSVEKENEILKWFDDKANAGQIITVKEIKAAFDKKLGEGYRTRLYLYAVSSARMDKEEASSGTSKEGKWRRNHCLKK